METSERQLLLAWIAAQGWLKSLGSRESLCVFVDPIVAMAALRGELERRISAVEQSAGPEQLALGLRSVLEFVHKLEARLRPQRGDRGEASATGGRQRPVRGWLYG